MTIATFAAGCFWGVEAKFRQVDGVISSRVGYTAGSTIEVTFDPAVISYATLLEVFWRIHNPTTLNRQGPDMGTQYRSAIFYHSDEQREQALASKQALDNSNYYPQPAVTEITAASEFFPAEEYHQCYLEKKGLGSCH
jgi:peptide-methionine (S)-S-oxide reductase